MLSQWLLVPVALAALAGGAWLTHSRQAPETPATAPWHARFPDVSGQPQPLAQWRGQVLVLNFWAPWCAPCREEIPDLNALRAAFGPRVTFLGLAVDQPAAVAAFLRHTPIEFPVLVGGGPAHALSRQLGNTTGALPYTVVLDGDGKVVFAHLGRVDPARLREALAKIGA